MDCFRIAIREGNGTPLQYSCLENPMDRGAWWAAVQGTQRVGHYWATELNWTELNFHALEKEMVTHSSVFAWRIPATGEPGGLPSMRSHRVGHDWRDLAAAAACLRSWEQREWTSAARPTTLTSVKSSIIEVFYPPKHCFLDLLFPDSFSELNDVKVSW